MSKFNVVILSEELFLPIDEGIKKVAYSLLTAARNKYDAVGICTTAAASFTDNTISIRANKTFLCPLLFFQLAKIKPDVLIYIPGPCGTVWSFLRAFVLCIYGALLDFDLKLVLLQPRQYNLFERTVIAHIPVPEVYVMGKNTGQSLSAFRFNPQIFFPGIDTEKFHPVLKQEKVALRVKYGFRGDEKIVLHAGHLSKFRGLLEAQMYIPKQFTFLLVTSTSTERDDTVREQLQKNGAAIMDTYIENIEEIYQLSDYYIFPVKNEHGAIEIPLSVLEALSCGIPTLSTRFGGLIQMLPEQTPSLYYFDDYEQIHEILNRRENDQPAIQTETLTRNFSWENSLEQIIN